MPGAKPRRGRPTTYTEEMAAEICERVMLGETISQICADSGMPCKRAVYVWLREHPDFMHQYARAREESGHIAADEVLDLARRVLSGEVQPDQARIVFQALTWTAGKRKPKVYGDRHIVDVGTDTLKAMTDQQLDAEIARLAKQIGFATAQHQTRADDESEPSR